MPESIFLLIKLGKIRLELRRERTAKIFIVHGHDCSAKSEVDKFLNSFGLNTVILNEKANQGMTIIEKFEHYSKVSLAVILLTPDDIGYNKNHPDESSYRARQNVILELGFFLGRIGRERVCALYKEGVELPSDCKGICNIQFDEKGKWKDALVKEIKVIGIV